MTPAVPICSGISCRTADDATIARTERARNSQAPITEVRDACALLADGMAEADFAQKRWLIRHLVRVIYADKEGWKLEGHLPRMHAEGVFPAGSFEEYTS